MERGDEFTGPDSEIVKLIESLGFQVADYNVRRVNRTLQIHLILYNSEGISLNDCSSVYRTIMPKIEVVYDHRNVHLEVSSPGISRKIKTIRELALYTEKGVSILVNNQWNGGVIKEVNDNLILTTKAGELVVAFNDIQKAKLDHTQEVLS